MHVGGERARPGHLHVSGLVQAAYTGRPHLYVVGLEEGRVFPTASEDPVLLDAERQAIAGDLRLSADRIDEAVYTVLARLASWSANSVAGGLPGKVTFSYSCRDTREFRETYASWLVLQAFRLQQRRPASTYHDLKSSLGEPVSSLPASREHAASAAGWWTRSVVGASKGGERLVESAFAGVARGRVAEAGRNSEGFTEFDGHVPAAGPKLDPCASGNAYSVTELESAASCAFRHFLKRGLGLRPIEGRERDREIWLDPLTRGSELHDVYAALLRRCRDAARRPSLEADAEWLRSLALARLTALEQEMPPATAEILDRESRDFLDDVELFLSAESADGAATAVGLEVSFGRPLEDDAEALARSEPIAISLGEGLTFRIAGRIDRIDHLGTNQFEVIDYKTGGFWRDGWQGVFNGGRRLQHALYGLAAVELLRSRHKNPKVAAGVYYFSSHKGQQERVRIPAPATSEMAAVLADLRELIMTGAFVHTPKPDDCRYCDFTAACGTNAVTQAERKLGDSKLIAYGRLAAHV